MGSQDTRNETPPPSRTFSSLNNQDLESMRFEQRRLDTFMDNWPANAPVEARKVAKAGLFRSASTSSSSSSTSVLCPWCGCMLDGWNFGDQVMARHRQASPDCPFILNSSDNVPLIGEQPSANSSANNSVVSSNNAGEEIVRGEFAFLDHFTVLALGPLPYK